MTTAMDVESETDVIVPTTADIARRVSVMVGDIDSAWATCENEMHSALSQQLHLPQQQGLAEQGPLPAQPLQFAYLHVAE